MNDVECPYCGKGQEICHDDGYGYDENETYQQECSCGKTFVFHTTIVIDHNAYEAPCLNGEPHNYEKVIKVPKVINGFEEYRCKWCDEGENRLSECSIGCEKDKLHECYDCDIPK